MSTHISALLLFFLIFSTQSNSLQLVQFKTLISRSLLTRVSSARGDAAGSDRAAAFADSLRLLRFLGGASGGGGIWAVGWDFARKYAWRLGFASTTEISLAAAELTGVLAEAAMSGPDKDWVIRNYDRVFRLSNSLLRSLLKAFSQARVIPSNVSCTLTDDPGEKPHQACPIPGQPCEWVDTRPQRVQFDNCMKALVR